ncbi:hypothetical protein ELY15_08825 [Legionella sp. km772]|nr:hypothetical protein ELY15_08825 [Legionella sp. km772]
MRGGRYCEVIIGTSLTKYAVYNTWGLNNCPEDKWSHLTSAEVKKETQASRIHLNGPRYWIIDGFKNTSLINPSTRMIGGIAMREAGIIHLDLMTLLGAKKYYQTHEVDRKTTWIYQANKPVYELIDPKGRVYVMQSYSIELKPQTMQSLKNLGDKLQLPQGWKFKTGTLKKTQTLIAADAKAIVIQDDYLNTYQQATHDFLP